MSKIKQFYYKNALRVAEEDYKNKLIWITRQIMELEDLELKINSLRSKLKEHNKNG